MGNAVTEASIVISYHWVIRTPRSRLARLRRERANDNGRATGRRPYQMLNSRHNATYTGVQLRSRTWAQARPACGTRCHFRRETFDHVITLISRVTVSRVRVEYLIRGIVGALGAARLLLSFRLLCALGSD